MDVDGDLDDVAGGGVDHAHDDYVCVGVCLCVCVCARHPHGVGGPFSCCSVVCASLLFGFFYLISSY